MVPISEEKSLCQMNTKLLCFASYNCTGLGEEKMDYSQLITKSFDIDILSLQEHWLLTDNLVKFNFMCDRYMYHGISGVEEENQNIIQGRPYGGVAIMWKKSLFHILKPMNNKPFRSCYPRI